MSEIVAIHREPFRIKPEVYIVPKGETLEQMARRVRSLPEGWPRHEHDAICINGQAVPRALWGMVKPKHKAGIPVEVTFHAPPIGGGGGGKQILSIVASIGLLAISGGITNAVLGALGGVEANGAAASLARLAGAAVLIGGSAVLQALTPTPSAPRPQDSQDARDLGSASASGNVLEPNTPLPRVVGTRKVFPPFVTEPLIYFDGEDEVAEVVAALAGPHLLEDIRLGDALAADVRGIELETREGWPGLDPLTIVTRYGRTARDGSPIRGHTVNPEDKEQLITTTGDITDAMPLPKVIATRSAPDEVWLGLQFNQGLFLTDALTEQLRVPLRIRMRLRGAATWINLPEIHYQAVVQGPKRCSIKFVWRDSPVEVSAVSTTGWVEARLTTPTQNIAPVGAGGWQADAYFDKDTGGDHYVTSDNAGTTDVINVIAGNDVCEFRLDRATFTPGIYEIEITRGYAFQKANYTASSYHLSGSVRDPFSYEGASAERIFQTKENLIDEVVLLRHNSVWNSPPVIKGNAAIIAIKARNASVERLSVLASGYVRDWDGAGWTNWTTTSNPAPHLRDILTGEMNATRLPAEVIDDQSLVDWRADNWTCDAVIEGLSVDEAAQIVAGTGFGQLYQSETFGVVRDRDRSADTPIQVFTPQNSARFTWSRGYPNLPDGFRATFVDADQDYEARQIIHPPGAGRTEQVSIEGLVSEADVRTRLQYDLDVARLRAAFYSWDAAAEAIKCRRGALVGVVSDVLSDRVFSGRIVDFDFDGSGDIEAVRIETELDLTAEPTWADITDLSAVTNMALIGAKFGMAIRRKGETVTTHEVTTSVRGTDWLDLVTPATLAGLDYGDLAAVGPLGREYRRLIVVDMVPRGLTEWSITAVGEAPEIWA